MTEKPSSSVPLSKSAPSAADAADVSRPRQVVLATGALGVAAVGALTGSLVLLGQKSWLHRTQKKAVETTYHDAVKAYQKSKQTASDKKTLADAVKAYKKDHDPSKINSVVDSTVHSQLIATAVTVLIVAFLAYSVFKGRPWSRWGVIGVWVLSTFTGSLVGISSVLFIGSSDVPIAFRIPVFIAGLAFVAAVVLTSMRPSVAFFNAHRPPGQPQRRGLFAPREPLARGGRGTRGPAGTAATADRTAKQPAATRPAGKAEPDRSRSKQRAGADAVAKGAELARTRAKASKSRRTGTS